MIPTLSPADLAMVDQEAADVRGMLDDVVARHPCLEHLLSGVRSRQSSRLVATDCLARLSEVADQPLAYQMRVVIARLHAWDTVMVMTP